MSDEIRPALTPDAWATVLRRGDASYFASTEDVSDHAKAALYLHGQPFGVTHDDAEWLRLLAGNHTIDLARLPEWAASLRDRIAALLPPPPNAL